MIIKVHNYSLRKEKGFTLVEVLVIVVLFSVVLVIASTVLMSISKINNKSRLINSLRNDGVRIMEEIERNIKTADAVGNPGGNVQMLVYLKDSEINVYEIVVTGNNDNNYIKRLENCDSTLTYCTSEIKITPDSLTDGFNVSDLSRFDTFNDNEVRPALLFEQSKFAPDLPDYKANVWFASVIKLRNY